MAVLVKSDDAEAFRVVDKIAEHGAAPGFGVGGRGLEALGETGAVEDIVAQHHRAGIAGDELLAQQERLRKAVRAGLDLVLQVHAVLAAVAEQLLKARGIGGGGDDQDVLDARQHQRGQRIVDHGLIVHRQKLLGCDHGQRVQSCAGAAGKDDTFHSYNSRLQFAMRTAHPEGA